MQTTRDKKNSLSSPKSPFTTFNNSLGPTNDSNGPASYAKTVIIHASRQKENCLFPGSNYRHLAHFFRQTQSPQPIVDDSYIFVASHDLNKDGDGRIRAYRAGSSGLNEFT